MKQLSALRYLLFALLITAVSSCGDDDKPSPTSTKTYAIKVRIVGNRFGRATGLITSTYDFAGVRGKTAPGPRFMDNYSNSIDTTYDLGKFGDFDEVVAHIEKTASQDASSILRAEIIVDGVVKANCELKGTAAGTQECVIETDNL